MTRHLRILATFLLLGISLPAWSVTPPDGNCGRSLSDKRARIKLQPGDQILDYWKCSACGTVQTAVADKAGNQNCKNCAKAHGDEPYIPAKVEHVGNDVYLLEPDMLIDAGSDMDAFAGTGPVWVCGHCATSNKGTASSCSKCGAPQANKDGSFDGYTMPEKPSRVRAQAKQEEQAAIEQGRNGVDWEKKGPTAYQKVRKYVLITAISGGVMIGSIYGYYKAMKTYMLEGTLRGRPDGSYVIEYREDDQSKTRLLKPQDEIEIPIHRNGERATLHFRNISGLLGVERSNGDTFAPEGK